MIGRLILCELYVEIVSRKEQIDLKLLARNIVTLTRVFFTAERCVIGLLEEVRKMPHLDSNGSYIGRCEMILGLLYKVKKKRALALQHLAEAQRILSQFGPTPQLARIEAALAELAAA